VLNPLWYAGALALGMLAGRAGDKVSLGFMAETERQVERHLQSHLARLPATDQRSRAIVDAMKMDEAGHAREAMSRGGVQLPFPVRWAMKASARVMTTVAHRI
jgi:ubiquinone biosynthesis monooxygenase Coq7